ncbi:AraC family transcriptional regulator [Parashewanella spongiae]|uniref:AraC family transcriptional regulator n=1 Tax=Parashewanella spongiae TaxID=342950 RepID=A0A3A6UH92_9GAMM|nr:AraC family transcriptional regulator [Parashewanella spongiae]MCL1077417.1 AraC family transcriptional regulator [Parashewanella spongiae]RJY18366.1 AraC family transcriptional regulator [Parashewanella spongiae]
MQLLNQILSSFHLNATIFHRAKMCNTWSTDTSGSGHASFHFISSGNAYLHTQEHQGVELNAGDMVIFPHDSQHLISNSSTANPDAPFISYAMDQSFPQSTGLVCGYFDFSEDKTHPLLQQLPACIILKQNSDHNLNRFLIHALVAEVELGALSSNVMLSRMSEVFFMSVLRSLADEPEKVGFFKAIQDPKMYKVLTAIQNDLGFNWSVQNLAEIGGYSRASFAQHFKSYLGLSPLEYLTRLRLSSAQKRLKSGDSVFQVALEVGYQSDAAFAKAFKRHFGYGPGASRF